MKPEIEAKFLDIDFDEFRQRLQQAGAELVQPMRLMRRRNYDQADGSLEAKGGWVRLRDEGDRITLAYKQLNNREIDGTHEVTVEVNNFDDSAILLENAGLRQTSYQETKRESWVLDGVQIELDEWPWVPTFIETEAATDQEIVAVAARLGLDMDQAVHGSVEIVYRNYYDVTDLEVDAWPEIVFSEVPKWLEEKRI